MRHRKKKKIIGRKKQARKWLIIHLARSLIINHQIKTTLVKAKLAKNFTEKIITRSKTDNLNNRRYILRFFSTKLTNKIFKELAPKYKDRNGGYLRIIKLKPRKGDQAPLALLEFV